MEHNLNDTEAMKRKKLFRETHNCKHCFFFEKPRRCPAMDTCPLDEIKNPVGARRKEIFSCPKDDIGNCPYGNEAGTCFGYCWKEILRDFKRARESKEE